MDGYYEVRAFSGAYPEILFRARAAFDGSCLSDEYVVSRVCASAEEQIEKNLGGLPGYLTVKVTAVSKSIDSADICRVV